MKQAKLLLTGLIFINIFSVNIFSKVTIIEKGLSYDDVLLVPQKSYVSSRQSVSTRSRVTKNIWINVPIISANMDTVTESKMAIAMAQLGGIGVIHRFNSIENQVNEIKKVKRYRNAVIEHPLTIKPDSSIQEAQDIMQLNGVQSLLVTDNSDNNKLVGIITKRDLSFNPDLTNKVEQLMTPKEKLIVGQDGISIDEAQKILTKYHIEKLPLIKPDWTIAGLITAKDIYTKLKFPNASVDSNGRLLVGAAIGVKDDAFERAEKLVQAGADLLVIDIAHGHSESVLDTLNKIKSKFPQVDIIAGNVATAEGALELIKAGADAIKVGIGPGSICTTRIVSGSGYPQLSAIINCAQVAAQYNIPIIGDGGIRYSGDITKAIGAGASCVMLGSLLAGTDESPGIPFIKNGKKFKIVRGMASFGANLSRVEKTNSNKNAENYIPEGVEAIVPYKGNLTETINQLIGGLKSGMSYCGVDNLEELCGNATFIQITSAGITESHPHDVQQIAS